MDNVIDTISLTQLPNGAHFNYMQTTIERGEADEITEPTHDATATTPATRARRGAELAGGALDGRNNSAD